MADTCPSAPANAARTAAPVAQTCPHAWSQLTAAGRVMTLEAERQGFEITCIDGKWVWRASRQIFEASGFWTQSTPWNFVSHRRLQGTKVTGMARREGDVITLHVIEFPAVSPGPRARGEYLRRTRVDVGWLRFREQMLAPCVVGEDEERSAGRVQGDGK